MKLDALTMSHRCYSTLQCLISRCEDKPGSSLANITALRWRSNRVYISFVLRETLGDTAVYYYGAT